MIRQVLLTKTKYCSLFLFTLVLFIFSSNIPVFADSQSQHYVFKDYSFGASSGNASSPNYKMMGVAGEGTNGKMQSAHYILGQGLSYTLNAQTPLAPTITNPSNYYNKLSVTINTGSNPSDTNYAIAVSPDNFATTTKYVQADDTLGNTPVWKTNASWGPSGFTIIGLSPGVTYTAKVSAIQGLYTQSPYGPTAQATTVNPTLSFNLTPNSVAIGQLTPQTVVTAPSTVTVTVSSNGTSGATVYIKDASSGLFSPTMNYTISAVSGDLGSISEGYGIRGTSTSQSSGGPMEILSPYNGTGTTVGTLSSNNQILFDSTGQPITSGQGIFEIKARAANITKAASDYADTVTIIASSSF